MFYLRDYVSDEVIKKAVSLEEAFGFNEVSWDKKTVLEILTDPNSRFYYDDHQSFGFVFEAMNSEKGGVRFSLDGKMIGLLEPK